jgi:hypothetical protein
MAKRAEGRTGTPAAGTVVGLTSAVVAGRAVETGSDQPRQAPPLQEPTKSLAMYESRRVP